jgi:GR25 family glycosyltransferase involved in LPS biosynthesis
MKSLLQIMKQLDKIYVIHYTKLVDRKKYLIDKFKKINFDVEWITHFDRENVTQKQLDEFYKFDPLYKDIHINSVTGEPPIRHLRLPEICCLMSHYYCIEEQVKNNYEYILILEDDVVFENDAFIKVNNILNSLPEDCDICYLGNGCGLKPDNIVDGKTFYDTTFGVKAADSMILNLKSANYLLNKKTQIHRPIDYHINTFRDDLKIYWIEPSIFTQGSQIGLYKTAVQLSDYVWI